MSVIEFIGFIITMIVFFLLILKQGRDQRRRREHPEEFQEEEREQQEGMQELMESLNIRLGKQAPPKRPPPPPRLIEGEEDRLLIEAQRLQAEEIGILPSLEQEKAVFKDIYAKSLVQAPQPHHDAYRQLEKQRSRIQKKLNEPDSLKQAIIVREILGPPKGM
ncbi:MAG: hypothetical protein WB791_11215 [Waddliaceae bacterium]